MLNSPMVMLIKSIIIVGLHLMNAIDVSHICKIFYYINITSYMYENNKYKHNSVKSHANITSSEREGVVF